MGISCEDQPTEVEMSNSDEEMAHWRDCSCNSNCILYDNCCQDFQDTCPHFYEGEKFLPLRFKLIYKDGPNYGYCNDLSYGFWYHGCNYDSVEVSYHCASIQHDTFAEPLTFITNNAQGGQTIKAYNPRFRGHAQVFLIFIIEVAFSTALIN